MLDLHCHVLPGVDDGAIDLRDALALADDAVEQGCRAICATSHLWENLFDTSAALLEREYDEYVKAVRREGIPLEVFPGAENFLGQMAPEEFAEKSVPLGPGRKYVLFDFSLRAVPDHVGDTIVALLAGGRVPLIAHPERNLELQADPSRVAEWIAQGARIQVNAPSLLGLLGRAAQESAEHLLESGAAHVLASDAHDRKRRPFCLAAARDRVAQVYGEEEATRLTHDRPWQIARGETFDVPNVTIEPRSGPRRLLRRLFDRL